MATCPEYDDLTWLSFARGLLESSVAAEMELHCVSCNECSSRMDFFRKIAGTIDLNSADPPQSWTDESAAKFDFATPSSTNVFGELVFDSYLHDKEAVRSRSLETRRLVFDLPTLEVDLALEYSGRRINVIMGHLLSKAAEPAPTVHDFSLELLVADRTYSTKPNRFGEFSFSVDAQITGEPLELRCAFEEGQCAVILIPC